jgi:peptidoglycan/LPS O-acetylase OafA/YrhL
VNLKNSQTRLAGLDLLRACAILLVFMSHYMAFVSKEASFGFLSEIGWIGVDLFFVLSGYLIGNQIFSELRNSSSFALKRFYIRRLLRTLPNFYVVLAIFLLFPIAAGGNPATPIWKFLSFTQNFNLIPGTAFSHAWSLCIEEQFYAVFPLFALLCLAKLKSWRAMWALLILAMLSGVVMRYFVWTKLADESANFAVDIYFSTWTRFDELLPGVILALLKNYHLKLWKSAESRPHLSLLLGAAITSLAIFLFSNYRFDQEGDYLWFTTTFGYTILSCGFAILCLSALSPASLLNRFRIPGATTLALWSYALYLIHKPVMNALIKPFQEIGLSVKEWPGIVTMFGASLLATYVLYTIVEMPFMRLRERYFP